MRACEPGQPLQPILLFPWHPHLLEKGSQGLHPCLVLQHLFMDLLPIIVLIPFEPVDATTSCGIKFQAFTPCCIEKYVWLNANIFLSFVVKSAAWNQPCTHSPTFCCPSLFPTLPHPDLSSTCFKFHSAI